MHSRQPLQHVNTTDLYDFQHCPDCGTIILLAIDDPDKRRELEGSRHVCCNQGEPLQRSNFPSDLGPRKLKDDLKKSYEDRDKPESGRTS